MPNLDPRLIIAFAWITGCALVTFALFVRRPIALPPISYALVVALIVRLIPALVLPRGAMYEMQVFRQVGQTTLEGRSVYLTSTAYPYLPLQLYWAAAAYWLSSHVSLVSFPFWLKLPNILADTAMVILIYQAIHKQRNERDALLGSWMFALNPITILVTAYQGQFDATPLLLVMAAWYWTEFCADRNWGAVLSALALGFGIFAKTWPVILMPIVLLRPHPWHWRWRFIAIAVAIPVAGTLLYETLFPGSLISILRRSLYAGAISGWWGYSSILSVIVELTGQGMALYQSATTIGKTGSLLAGLLVIWLTRHRSSLQSLLLTILTLFAAVPNLGLQGLSWLIPTAVILSSSQLGLYIVGALIHMVISYWGIHLTNGLYLLMPTLYANMIIKLSSLTAWGTIVLWLAKDFPEGHDSMFAPDQKNL